jgi:integrase
MYYFRRGIPARLRPIIGAREFFFSLGVKDREAAKRLLPQHAADTQRQLDEAHAELQSQQAAPASAQRVNIGQYPHTQAQAEWQEDNDTYWSGVFAEDDERALEADEYEKRLLSAPKLELTPAERLAAHLLREARGEVGRYRGRYQRRKKRDQRQALAAPDGQAEQPKAEAAPPPAVSIKKMFEAYAKQPGIRPETVNQFRAIIRHLTAFLGHDDASVVSAHDLVRWRNHLQQEEVKPGKTRSAKTVNDSYLAAANVVFAYGVDQMSIAANRMRDVAKVRAQKVVKLREKDFTKVERKAILSAALKPSTDKRSAERVAARRWVPWLCAYTGARVNEMTQLRAEDVTQIDGVWAVHITPEAGNVKTDAARYVPIHEHLVEQGFLDFLKGKLGPIFYNPDRERTGMARGQYKRTGMYLAEWVRGLGVNDPSIKPNHAWRHTFKTICSEAGIAERAADYMQGHASKGVGRSYGSNSMAALAEQLKLFPRFEVPED